MQDRNGNRISFLYDPNGRVMRITDSLSRQINFTYDVNDVSPYGLCDKITFQGYNATPRTIRVSKINLESVFRPRSNYAKRSLLYLFPDISGSDSTPFNPTITSAVWLPDGRSYKFYYNEYGELARVLLPTGGAMEYDWNAGMLNGQVGGAIGTGNIYRRVVERRVYPGGATGVNYESKSTYSRPENQTAGTNLGYVDASQYGAAATPLTVSRHYFNGSVLYNPNLGYDGQDYFPFNTGKEYKTEALDPSTLSALQRVEYAFFNQPPGWWTPPGWCTTCVAPSNNPVVTDAYTTWVSENLVARQSYQYDAFSNKIQIKEYDYGTGQAPAQPVRRTEIDYVTTGETNGIDYTGTTISSNVNALPYLRSYYGYDSPRRLIRVRNPEQDINTSIAAFNDPVTSNTQWAAAFTYDKNSNLSIKTDPRNIRCEYAYDGMNRVITRTYFNDPYQTPSVGYKYDGVGTTAQNALGKLASVATSGTFGSSYSYDNFDAVGRVLHSTQTTEGTAFGMSYGYDLAGNLISETYPSGRVVVTALDVAGRVSDISSGAVHYASSFTYAAFGGVTDVKLGNNLWEHTTFEPNRLAADRHLSGNNPRGIQQAQVEL